MLNDNFARIETFYKAINEINEIIASDDDKVKNFDCKLDAVLAAVQDIKKTEFNEDVSNRIIYSIKEGIEDIYMNDLINMHRSIGIDMTIEKHCPNK